MEPLLFVHANLKNQIMASSPVVLTYAPLF